MDVGVRGPTLLFDGDCAFCTAAAHCIEARWTRAAQAVAWQRLGERGLGDLGLTTADVRTAAYWVDERGRSFRGHRAVAKALMAGSAPYRLLGALLLAPPLSWVARPGYWLVARHRHRLPGATDSLRLTSRSRPLTGGAMITELSDMPAGVIGFETSGKIRAEDYRDVVLPAIERAAKTGEVRFLIVMPKFEGMSGGAVWHDLKVGIEHFGAWKRIALVTDVDWMAHMTSFFGWMTPGETKTFTLAERDQAIAWVAGLTGK